MAKDTRLKNISWDVTNANGNAASWVTVQVAVLMDIRDELQRLNNVFACSRFLNIPNQLEHVAKAARRANRNATKRRTAKKR